MIFTQTIFWFIIFAVSSFSVNFVNKKTLVLLLCALHVQKRQDHFVTIIMQNLFSLFSYEWCMIACYTVLLFALEHEKHSSNCDFRDDGNNIVSWIPDIFANESLFSPVVSHIVSMYCT